MSSTGTELPESQQEHYHNLMSPKYNQQSEQTQPHLSFNNQHLI